MPSNKKSHKKSHKYFSKYISNPITIFNPTKQLQQKTPQLKTPTNIRKYISKHTRKRKNKKLRKKLLEQQTKKDTIKVLSEPLKPIIDINPIVQASTQEIHQILEEQPIDESKIAQLDEKLESVNEIITQAVETVQSQPIINPNIIDLSESLQILIVCHGKCSNKHFEVPTNLQLLKKNISNIGDKHYSNTTPKDVMSFKTSLETSLNTCSTCDITSCYPMPDDIEKSYLDIIKWYRDAIAIYQSRITKLMITGNHSELSRVNKIIKEYTSRITPIMNILQNKQANLCKYKINIKFMLDKEYSMVTHPKNLIIKTSTSTSLLYDDNSGIFLKIPKHSGKLYNLFLESDIDELSVILKKDIKKDYFTGRNLILGTFIDGSTKNLYEFINIKTVLKICADIVKYLFHVLQLPLFILDGSCSAFSLNAHQSDIDSFKRRELTDDTFFYGGKIKRTKYKI